MRNYILSPSQHAVTCASVRFVGGNTIRNKSAAHEGWWLYRTMWLDYWQVSSGCKLCYCLASTMVFAQKWYLEHANFNLWFYARARTYILLYSQTGFDSTFLVVWLDKILNVICFNSNACFTCKSRVEYVSMLYMASLEYFWRRTMKFPLRTLTLAGINLS